MFICLTKQNNKNRPGLLNPVTPRDKRILLPLQFDGVFSLRSTSVVLKWRILQFVRMPKNGDAIIM